MYKQLQWLLAKPLPQYATQARGNGLGDKVIFTTYCLLAAAMIEKISFIQIVKYIIDTKGKTDLLHKDIKWKWKRLRLLR